MARNPPLLPHELIMKKKKDANDPIATDNVDAILCPPHLLMKKNKRYNEECVQHPCHLILNAYLVPIPSSSSSEPTTIINFNLKDQTNVIIPSPDHTTCYAFPCPINNNEPFAHRSCIKSSRFVRSVIPRDTIPMEIYYREYFESEMSKFICRVIKDAGDTFHVRVYVKASIEKRLWYESAVELAENIEEENNSDSPNDCAVCFEEVEVKWFQGVKLHCSHVFHLKCIAPWLMENNTCPTCRCVQVADMYN